MMMSRNSTAISNSNTTISKPRTNMHKHHHHSNHPASAGDKHQLTTARRSASSAALAILVAITFALGLSTTARAQVSYDAPAGNEHPQSQAISTAPAANPFGHAHLTHDTSTAKANAKALQRKADFARKLDLDPLRPLAVYHSGRVKVIDTLAREAISTITGRNDFFDVLDAPTSSYGSNNTESQINQEQTKRSKPVKVSFDPVFTYFDLMIDTQWYATRPLLHIEFLPLREAFLTFEFGDQNERLAQAAEGNATNEDLFQRWNKIGRLPPLMISRNAQAVQSRFGLTPGYAEGIGRLEQSALLVRDGWRNLLVIAPDAPDLPWHHLSELQQSDIVSAWGDIGHTAREALDELAIAWRAFDADRANAAIRTLAETLPLINADMYPGNTRYLETWYNRSGAFEWGAWLYLVSLVSLLLAFGTGRRWLVHTGMVFLVLAVLVHAAGFIARCVIAERFAIQNQFESMTGLSLFATIVGIAVMLGRRQTLFGAAAAATGFMVLIAATQTGIPGSSIEREAAILNTSYLLKYHVTIVLTSYGLISLGFICSLFYIATYYNAKLRGRMNTPAQVASAGGLGGGASSTSDVDLDAADLSAAALGLTGTGAAGTARVLKDLDSATMIVLQLAFWTLGVGILLGAWWADHSWGRWWAWDPKETWALITWIVYLIVIHARFGMTGPKRALTTAWLSIIGFIVMLWTYFGVNLILPGLHAYA